MLHFSLWKRFVIWGVVALGLFLAMPNLFYSQVEGHNDALQTIEAEGATPELIAARDAWPDWLPSNLVNLGLDLRGGAHLLAEVHVEDVYAGRIDGLWPEIRDSLRAERDAVGTVRRLDSAADELRIQISQSDGMSAALRVARALAAPVVTLTGVGERDLVVEGTGDILTVRLSPAEKRATDERTMLQSVEIIRRRVDEVGTREPNIQRVGDNRILIQVPGIGSAAELKSLIGTTARLTFHPVVGRTANPDQAPGARNIVLPSMDEPGVYYIIEQTPVVTGEELTDSQPAFDQNGRPSVTFRFNPSGARKFGDYTAANVGSPFAVVLDNEVITAPNIQEAIRGGTGQITGQFTVQESTELAVLLRAGALPAEMTFLEERTIGPELGADSIEAGQVAGVIAFVAVMIFMVFSYGIFGIFANIALAVNVGLLFGLLSVVGATLTLPGIAGIVLTIGMAIDANVLVFERIREEMRTAKGAARAIELGYERAMPTIVDANITTFIVGAVLFLMGTGPVKGFAVTLVFGILTSVFTALYVTRALTAMWMNPKRSKTFRMGGIKLLPDDTKINFFGLGRLLFGGSFVAMVASVVLVVVMGMNFGIDFRGGSTIRTNAEQAVDVGAYRAAISPLGLGDVTVTQVFDPSFAATDNVALIRIQAQEGTEAVSDTLIASVESALQEVDPTLTFESVESVGPKVSSELITTVFIAVGAALIGIMIYVWLRFEWQFAVASVVALFHDVVVTVGIFALFQLPFDLSIIAALLAIVGYSINDKVVIFDRVREIMRKYKKLDLRELLNLSINETLSRTLITSGTTLLALAALLIWGGDVIRGFALAIFIGIILGTYSSIFVATNFLLMLGVKREPAKAEAEPDGVETVEN